MACAKYKLSDFESNHLLGCAAVLKIDFNPSKK